MFNRRIREAAEGVIAVEFYSSIIEFLISIKLKNGLPEKDQFTVAVEKSVCQAKQVISR